MEAKGSKNVKILVMNPNNGEIFAMVNVPEFNLNKPYDIKSKKKLSQKELNQKLNDIKVQKTKTDDLLSNTLRNNNYLNLKIDSLNTSIQENSLLPYAVRQVLSNPKLSGIHGALGNLIDAPEKYARAITSSLGAAFSNVVV